MEGQGKGWNLPGQLSVTVQDPCTLNFQTITFISKDFCVTVYLTSIPVVFLKHPLNTLKEQVLSFGLVELQLTRLLYIGV